MARLGYVGLGTMGAPMAGHLVRAHGELTVWNRTPGKADILKIEGAKVATSLTDLARECDVILLNVNRSEDVLEVLGELLTAANKGTLFVDHSTIAPDAARECATMAQEKECRFVDAPVTGGSVGAVNGTLTIFLGGDEADVNEAIELIRPYTKNAQRVGPSGAGQTMKLANQIAVAGALEALCESLAFADAAGLDIAQARAMIAGGSGGSWAFENYGPKILARDWTPGFSVKNQRKDLGYTREAAARIGARVPGTALTDDLLKQLEDEGRGEETTAALYDVLAKGR